jgi:hypothetical protein
MSNDDDCADAPARRLLHCPDCGRSDEVTHDMWLASDEWPTCCGQVMVYFMTFPQPTPADTRFVHKCPLCGTEWAITFPAGVPVPERGDMACVRCRGKVPAVPPK